MTAAGVAIATEQSPLRESAPWFFWLLLFALCVADQMLVWQYPDADPASGYSRDNDLTVDGYWYLAEARGWHEGEDAVVGAGYRKPLVSIPMYGFYSIFGVGIASSRSLSACASLGTLILLVLLLRRRFGANMAVVGGILFVVEPAWHVYARSPVIYPWVGFWLLVVLAVASGRGALRWWLGGGLLALAALYLKALLWIAAPALAYEGWRRLRLGGGPWSRRRALLAASSGAILAAMIPFLPATAWERLAIYFGESASLLGNIFGFEENSRFFSAAAVSILLAWTGALGFLTHAFPTRGPRTPERMIHVTVWTSLAGLAFFSYTPLRYLSVLFPLLIYLAVSCINAAARLPARRPLSLGSWRRAGTAVF
ncbi:MAG: hypothetical protein L0Z55_00005, partial [Planctomycetes bacterium]|nr:hypothetical protein [Planctomycetota bacterium]